MKAQPCSRVLGQLDVCPQRVTDAKLADERLLPVEFILEHNLKDMSCHVALEITS